MCVCVSEGLWTCILLYFFIFGVAPLFAFIYLCCFFLFARCRTSAIRSLCARKISLNFYLVTFGEAGKNPFRYIRAHTNSSIRLGLLQHNTYALHPILKSSVKTNQNTRRPFLYDDFSQAGEVHESWNITHQQPQQQHQYTAEKNKKTHHETKERNNNKNST